MSKEQKQFSAICAFIKPPPTNEEEKAAEKEALKWQKPVGTDDKIPPLITGGRFKQ